MKNRKIIFLILSIMTILITFITLYISNNKSEPIKKSKITEMYAESSIGTNVQNYTIAFDANGGNGGTGGPSDITSTGGDVIIPSEVPTCSGWYFVEWRTWNGSVTVKPGGLIHNIENYVDNTGKIELIATWGVRITFDVTGGTWGVDDIITPRIDVYKLPLDIPTKEGQQFDCWTIKGTNSIKVNPNSEVSDIKSFADGEGIITFVANWKGLYTITYNANGGTVVPESQTKTEGEAITLSSAIPQREGYKFLGWSESNTATTATYAASSTFSENKSVTLYAVWEKESNNIIENDENKKDDGKTDNKITNIVNAEEKDNTKANTILPKAGVSTLKMIVIILIVICILWGLKYKITKLS